jgi:hypothetical protein
VGGERGGGRCRRLRDPSDEELRERLDDRPHAGTKPLDRGTEVERLDVTHEPSRRAFHQPSHEQEHLVLRRGRYHEVERIDRGPRVDRIEHFPRDHVRPGEHGERQSGLVAEP